MPYTEDQLQALQNALASPDKRIRFADREQESRSIAELKAAISEVSANIQSAAGTTTRVRRVRVCQDSDFD